MAKKQESYELMTVFSLKNGEEAAKELVEKFREKIASSATLDEVNEWGKRKLAYPINDEPDGTTHCIPLRPLRMFRQK